MRAIFGALVCLALLTLSTVVTPPDATAAPPPTSGFEKVKLEGGLQMGEPIELAVLPDQKVLYINRVPPTAAARCACTTPRQGPRRSP